MNKVVLSIIFFSITLHINAQNLSRVADSLMLKNKIPEMGFAVISTDSILELQVLGYHRTDIKNDTTKAKLSDYFHLGSNTKAITGFVAACMVESNKIKWDTKFFDLFPSWKKQCNPAYRDITLSDLLSHRAMIQPYMSGLEYQELPLFKGNISEQRKQFVKYILNEKPVKDTTNTYHYSNAGYSVAALMLEKVSGKTWEQLTKETMAKLHVDIQFGWPNKISTNQPYGHWIQNDTLIALPPDLDYNLSLAEPAGDICITLPDYAKFIQLNLLGLSGKDTVLKSATYKYLHYGKKEYSIGWSNMSNDTRQFSEHSGSAGTFFCYVLIDNRDHLAFIIMANSATDQAKKGVFTLLRYMINKYSR